jgi:hypothetical protein
MKKVILMLSAVALFTSCNKTRVNSNRFSGEIWKVVSITVNGVAEDQDHLPVFEFEDCDIYEEVCMGHWVLNNEDAHFAWQFTDNGETLTISNQSESSHEHEHEDDYQHMDPVEQCQNFSGSYVVVVSKRKSMEISSTETIGYPGAEVLIELKHID